MITDYASLKTAIANWLHRTDLTATIPEFVANAEAILNSRLKARAMETRSTLATVANTAYLTLPTDMLEARRLTNTTDSSVYSLKYVTPDDLARLYPYAAGYGKPIVWTVIGGQIQMGPTPDGVYSLELTYLQRVPALSDSNTTNWLLTNSPNVYLYGALSEASIFIRDDDAAGKYGAMFQAGIESINSVDWYSGSTMTVRAV